FDSVTKYGLQLALMLPTLLAAERIAIRADLRWGKAKDPVTFHLERRGASTPDEPARLPDEVAALVEQFQAPRSGWTARPADTVFDLPGVGICVPDLRFDHTTGARVFLEVLGYW